MDDHSLLVGEPLLVGEALMLPEALAEGLAVGVVEGVAFDEDGLGLSLEGRGVGLTVAGGGAVVVTRGREADLSPRVAVG
jgi:hypothetical protein